MPISGWVQERTFNRTSSIAEITDNLKKAIENNLFTSGVFLDFAKAVDTVNHSILLEKLERYEIRGQPLLSPVQLIRFLLEYLQMILTYLLLHINLQI